MLATSFSARCRCSQQLLRMVRVRNGRNLCSDKQQEEEMRNVLESSIKESVDKIPELSAELRKEALHQEQAGNPQPPLSVTSDERTDFSNLNLSHENVLIDTYALIKAFQSANFTQAQAECITYTFTQILNEALRIQRNSFVEKASLDIMREQTNAHLGAMRKDMTILEKSELSDLRNEIEKLRLEFGQHQSKMAEEINRVKNQLTLDVNMERSRAKDDHTITEKEISKLTTKMTAEVGRLETTSEKYKNDLYRAAGGTLLSLLTLLFAYYRLVKS